MIDRIAFRQRKLIWNETLEVARAKNEVPDRNKCSHRPRPESDRARAHNRAQNTPLEIRPVKTEKDEIVAAQIAGPDTERSADPVRR